MRPSLLTVALTALLVACGGNGNHPATPTASAPETPTSVASSASPTRAASPSATATTATGVAAIDYSNPANWLCRPGKTGTPCTDNLDSTFVWGDGGHRVDHFAAAPDPPIDCFYIYPTASTDPGLNSDMIPGDGEARAALNQAARFASVCKVYAPVYRQITLTALNSGRYADPTAAAIAYGDVLNAWNDYLANDNHGRGVVIIAHSQGSRWARQLMSTEIDPSAHERSLLVSAILLGGDVRVPAGKDAGGDFQNIPACRKPDQTGCVIAYSSFAATSPPPANSLFARGDVLCSNPAALAGGASSLLSYFPAAGIAGVTTPFIEYDGFTGECVVAGGFSYLKITSPPGLDFPGAAITALGPQWGLHIVDSNLTLGNQVALVGSETAAYLKR